MKINQPDDVNAAVPEAFEALVVPDGLSEQEAENARGHLDWVHGDARQFSIDLRDAEAASPADPRLVARARVSAAQLLHSLQDLQAAHEVMVPAGFIDNWRRATDVRLRTLGATSGEVSSDEPRAFTLRPFRSKRLAIGAMTFESLEARADDMMWRAQRIVMSSWPILVFGTGGSEESLTEQLTQILHDEVQVRLELESLDQRLDRYSSPPYQLRTHPEFREAMVTLGLDLTLAPGSASALEAVKLSTHIERAWAVNNLILDMIETAPERVGSIMSRDVTRAVQGDLNAWERLRATCSPGRGSRQSPKSLSAADDLRAQDRAIDAALDEERQRREEFEASISAYVDANLPASDDPDEVESMRATLEGIVRERKAGREPSFFTRRGRFSPDEFRRERDALCLAISLEEALCDWLRHFAQRFSPGYTSADAPSPADRDVQERAVAFRQAHPRDSLYRLAVHGEKVRAVLAGLRTAGPGYGPVPFGGGSRTIAERSSSSSQSARDPQDATPSVGADAHQIPAVDPVADQGDCAGWRARCGGGGDVVEAPGWPAYDRGVRAPGAAATMHVQLQSGSLVRESGEDAARDGTGGPAITHVRESVSQSALHFTGDSAEVLPTTHVGDGGAVISGDDARVLTEQSDDDDPSASSDTSRPIGRDAEWVRLWNQGRSDREIASQFGVSRKTVSNCISLLRHRYSEAVVPYHRQRN